MGEIVFTCVRTGRAFSSGFQATSDDLQFAPPQLKTRLFCRICHVTHEFDFATACICECPDYCHKKRIDCQLCKLEPLASAHVVRTDGAPPACSQLPMIRARCSRSVGHVFGKQCPSSDEHSRRCHRCRLGEVRDLLIERHPGMPRRLPD